MVRYCLIFLIIFLIAVFLSGCASFEDLPKADKKRIELGQETTAPWGYIDWMKRQKGDTE